MCIDCDYVLATSAFLRPKRNGISKSIDVFLVMLSYSCIAIHCILAHRRNPTGFDVQYCHAKVTASQDFPTLPKGCSSSLSVHTLASMGVKWVVQHLHLVFFWKES
jgi:hypothetical protein